MPIEFTCEECSSVLRVPDGCSGKRSRCPACHHQQEVPFVVDTAADIAGAEASSPGDNRLRIPCPKCHHHLICTEELLGTRGQCKQCSHIFTITTDANVVDEGAPALVFHCPQCHQLFEGREEMRGRKGKCHVCQAVFPIELKRANSPGRTASAERSAPLPAAGGNAAASTSASAASKEPAGAASRPHAPTARSQSGKTSQSTSSSAGSPARTSSTGRPAALPAVAEDIRFECTECQGMMEVPGTAAGLETECPYCQAIQTIPDPTEVAVASPSARGRTPAGAAAQAATTVQPMQSFDPLGNYAEGYANDVFSNLDMSGPVNPYAAAPSAWSTASSGGMYGAAMRRPAMSVGAVLQTGFEALFPSCLVVLLHSLIAFFGTMFMYGIFFMAVLALAALRPPPEVAMTVGIILGLLLLTGAILLGAWFAGAVARMALDAVRKEPLDIGRALAPGGAFGAALLVAGGYMLCVLIAYLPMLVNLVTQGALNGLVALQLMWLLLSVPVIIIYLTLSSLAYFAGADGEDSTEAMQTSMRLVSRHLGTMLGVKILAWLIAIVAALPTLGLAYVVPIYMNAALYHAARKRSE